MIVSELMFRDVVSVEPETSLADAARMMLARHISGLPVVDRAGRLVGMVTEGDLLCRSELATDGKQAGWFRTFFMPGSLASDYVRSHGRHVSEVMTPDPISVSPETPLSEVADIMRGKRVKRLPVLDGGRLVGVIGRTDLLRVLALKLIEVPAGEATDESIGAYIKEALVHESWAPHSGVRVQVRDHVVNLEGAIFSDAERRAVKVVAENAPGVKEIHDNLYFVDPGSGMAFPGPV